MSNRELAAEFLGGVVFVTAMAVCVWLAHAL